MTSPGTDDEGERQDQDARAWWTLAVTVAVILVAYLGIMGLSAGMSRDETEPADPSRPLVATVEATEGTAGSTDSDSTEAEPATAPESLGAPLDRDELTGLGEFGALPGLLDDFSSLQDCEFDGALSTCQ